MNRNEVIDMEPAWASEEVCAEESRCDAPAKHPEEPGLALRVLRALERQGLRVDHGKWRTQATEWWIARGEEVGGPVPFRTETQLSGLQPTETDAPQDWDWVPETITYTGKTQSEVSYASWQGTGTRTGSFTATYKWKRQATDGLE